MTFGPPNSGPGANTIGADNAQVAEARAKAQAPKGALEMTMASELTWLTVDLDELSEANRTLYLEAKEAYKAYKAARDAFEQAMQDDAAEALPAGMELKFGYNFGKLSVAVGPAKERKASKAQSKGTLADFLANASAGGHRA